jgi:hypothetical protein
VPLLRYLSRESVDGHPRPRPRDGPQRCGAHRRWKQKQRLPHPTPSSRDGPSSPEPDPDLEASILSAEPDYTREVVAIDGRGARYAYARLDLNGDERGEILVYLMGSIFCGSGGCNLLLFTDTGEGYDLVDRFPITRLPVIVSAETAGGWNVIVRRESGGGAPPSWVEHAFDGETYAEAARRPGDASPEGRRLLEGASYETGIPLTPRRY